MLRCFPLCCCLKSKKLNAMPQMHVGSCVFLNVYLMNLNKKLVLSHDIFIQYKEPICQEVTPNNLTILKMSSVCVSIIYCKALRVHGDPSLVALDSARQSLTHWTSEQLCSTHGCRIITITSDFFPDVAVSPGRHTRLVSFSLLRNWKLTESIGPLQARNNTC